MIWKRHEFGYGSTMKIDDGLLITVNKSMTKDVWYGYIFANAHCITTKTEKEAKELCLIGAKNILKRAYQKICE